jgi:nucleotide-binding universal stress UspA family protein
MWLTKKILVATDFAEPSKVAADVGVELAEAFHVPLVLVHAYLVPTPIYMGVPVAPVSDYIGTFEEAARESLEAEHARLKKRGADVGTVLCAGVAWEEILSTAEHIDAGLIVMGTHGRHGLPRAVLGSVAEKVVRLSPVPVLTVHAPSATASTRRSKANEAEPARAGAQR